MNTPGKSSSKSKPRRLKQLFRRLDIRLPWLKLVAVIIVGIIAIIDLLDFTISRANDPLSKIKIAPMSKHVRVTERVLAGKMLVALTFDDGPSSATTPKLLDILYEKDAPATFFMLGNMARNNPELVLRATKEGNEVGSHTMYHQNLIRISPAAMQTDIDESNAVFSSILGHNPTLIRPPYGNTNDNVRRITNTPLILWSVDTLDWKNKDTSSIVDTAISQVHDGAVILMHDIYPTTIEAVPILIDRLRQLGYEFATIPELAEIRGQSLSPGNIYYNFRP